MERQGDLTSRPWSSPADVAAMAAGLSRAWAGPRRPLIAGTPGDLEWWTISADADTDWSQRIRIWEMDGAVVGWGWFRPPASLDWFVDPELTAEDERAVRAEILDWHQLQALRGARERLREDLAETTGPPDGHSDPDADRERGRNGEPDADRDLHPDADSDPTTLELETWAGDGWLEAAILAERGWTPSDVTLSQHVQRLDVELDPPRLPDGYRLRSLRGEEDIPARVAVHRAAFDPSKLTIEKYRRLPQQPHYRFDHDLVIEAPDGTFAAFAICWLDPVGSVGEFEPVGVHPDHQRRGLGRVVMRAGLRLMRDAGMRDALVFSLQSNAASEALYRSAGFEIVAVHRLHRRPLLRGS